MSIPFIRTVNKLTLDELPEVLQTIPAPPKQLFVTGTALDELVSRPRVAIVGSRKITPYGREVTMRLAGELARRGIVVISGLALGVDGLAHKAALEAGGSTVAVLPSPLRRIYPSSHQQLARQIVEHGGTLVTEYAEDAGYNRAVFIARNRLISGLAQAVLITEAAEQSGSLHTARFALEQGRDVLAVPGSIFSETSIGTNNLIKAGATPVTSYLDVLHALGMEDTEAQPLIHGASEAEQTILDLIVAGTRDGEELLLASKLDVAAFNQTLTMLEITGKIRSLGAGNWTLQ